MKNLTRQDWVVLVLVLLLMLITSALFPIIDETAVEVALPWYLGAIMTLGYALSMVIHAPTAFVWSLVTGGPIASHSAYFSILPFITAFVYTAILGVIMNQVRGKGSKK